MIRDGRYIDLSKRVVIRGQKKEKKNIYIYIKGTYEKKKHWKDRLSAVTSICKPPSVAA